MGRLRLLYLCFIVGQVWLTPVYTTPGYFFFLGPISTRDNCVLNGSLGQSILLFAHTTHSAHLLRRAPLNYARFTCSIHSLARSIHRLVQSLYWLRGMDKIPNYDFTLRMRSMRIDAIVVVTRNAPWIFFFLLLGSGPEGEGVDDLCFHTYGEFSRPPIHPSPRSHSWLGKKSKNVFQFFESRVRN